MMRLPRLTPDEQACLHALLPNPAVPAFAARLRQRLAASLGTAAEVRALPGDAAPAPPGGEPCIAIAPGLAAAWLALRLGGRPGQGDEPPRDARLLKPLRRLIRRTLAESVVNAGEPVWPDVLRLRLVLGGREGMIEIVWNGAAAMRWASRTLREKT